MKFKYYLILLIATNFFSCKNEVKCSDEEVKNAVVKEINKIIQTDVKTLFENKDFIEHKNFNLLKPIIDENLKMVEDFKFKLFSIRTDEYKKEINKCQCTSELNFIENEKNINLIKNELSQVNIGDFNIEGLKVSVNYNSQLTDADEIYVEILNKDILSQFTKNLFAKILYKIRLKNEEIETGITTEVVSDENNSENTSLNIETKLDSILINDINNPSLVQKNKNCNEDLYCNIAYKWAELYNMLPKTYKQSVITTSGDVYEMSNNDYYGLNKGFGIGSNNQKLNNVANGITETFDYDKEELGFRSGMVFFYVKYKIFKED